MKNFFILLCMLSFSIAKAQPAPLPAQDILNDAIAQAKIEKKNVLVMFHASWCVWCHKMDASMNDDACKKFFDDNFVIRHVVVDESDDKKQLENPGGNELRNKYHGGATGTGIPFWLVFDKNGKLISDSKIRKTGDTPDDGENVGCPASEKEVAFLISILKQTTRLTADQLEIIRKRFRQNDVN